MRFLGFEQRPVTLADRAVLAPFLARHPHPLSGYTFAALFGWRDAFDYAWCFADEGLLLVSCRLAPGGERHLIQPIGTLRAETAEKLLREASALPYEVELVGVGERFLKENRAFAERFVVTPDRGTANYIYRARDLADLRGARFAKKRNLLSQATSAYAWSAEPLRAEHAEVCRSVLHEIEEREAGTHETDHEVPSEPGAARTAVCAAPTLVAPGTRREEVRALEATLDELGALGQEGVLVSVEGQPAAFSIFEPQGADMAVVHFERAFRSRKGLYQVINRETARAIADRGFTWLNREEDLNDPGLRQAKSSYHPAGLAGAWRLRLRRPAA